MLLLCEIDCISLNEVISVSVLQLLKCFTLCCQFGKPVIQCIHAVG